MHLFDTTLPWAVFEAQANGAGQDLLRFTRLEATLTEHGSGIDQLELVLGTVRQSFGIPALAMRIRKRGGGKGVPMADGMEVIA